MKFFVTAGMALVAAAGLSACSQKAQNESAEAANAIGADASATTENAVGDVDTATDQALGSAAATMDNAGDSIAAGADRTGNAISNGADRAADATGAALKDAGNAIQD